MARKIISIDENKCSGCGLCVSACHEGAIGMVDGKAKLIRDDYCDGLGSCLPVCPVGAISFREAADKQDETLACGCPGTHSKTIRREESETPREHTENSAAVKTATHLNQWPVQIKLVPAAAPYFENANLLVSADCAAYAYGNFHSEFMKNKITVIGCPKLDGADYSEKLAAILKQNNIKSVTVVRMEVPCCGGMENAVKIALQNCGKIIPWQVVTISTGGRILEN